MFWAHFPPKNRDKFAGTSDKYFKAWNPNKEERKKVTNPNAERKTTTQNQPSTHSTHAKYVIDILYTFYGIWLSCVVESRLLHIVYVWFNLQPHIDHTSHLINISSVFILFSKLLLPDSYFKMSTLKTKHVVAKRLGIQPLVYGTPLLIFVLCMFNVSLKFTIKRLFFAGFLASQMGCWDSDQWAKKWFCHFSQIN